MLMNLKLVQLFLLYECTSKLIVLPFLPMYASENNIDDKQIVILVSLTGAVDFISRIISGILADRPEIKTYHILAVSQAVVI
jgi:MFS family permease